jgi:hypothetical protein
VFRLKCNPYYGTWTVLRTERPNQWQFWILAALSRICNWCIASNRYGRNFKLFCHSLNTRHVRTLPFRNVATVGGLLPYLVQPCYVARFWMLHEQQQTVLTENCSKRMQVVLANGPCSHLHSFSGSGVSSGLATRVTLTPVSWGRVGESVALAWTCFWPNFYAVFCDCCWVAF